MSTLRSGALRGLAFALLTLFQLCFATFANAQAGTVLATNGQNQIKRATQIIAPLKPGNAVQANDTIVTEANGRLQVRFVDGAIVSMQPSTQFRVDQYQFKEEESSSFFSLLRGAVRMASGLIGKKDPKQWRMTTPSATIGIRGTHFVVEHTVCDPDCSPGNKPGTRVAVTQGEVVVSNASGTIVLSANQSAFVSDPDTPPFADRWTPELLPRTVPPAPSRTGPARSTRSNDASGNEDSSESDGDARDNADTPDSGSGKDDTNNSEAGNKTGNEPESEPGREPGNAPGNQPGNKPERAPGNEPANEPGSEPGTEPGSGPGSEPRSDADPFRPIGDGANNGLRWEPDPVNPFDPVRDIALADPALDTGNRPNSNESDGAGNSGSCNVENTRDSTSDGELAGEGDNDQNSDSSSENANNGESNNGGNSSENNNGNNQNQSGNDTADGSNTGGNNPNGSDPGISDPGISDPNVGDPGEPTIGDPGLAGPGDPDPGTNNPGEPAPTDSTTPQIGSSFATNWFLDLRPMPNLVQQGLLSDPQSAVVFSEGITLESIGRCDGGICISRGTTQVAEAGHDEYAAWGRWTNGQMHVQIFGLTQPITLSENEGLHYIVGSPTVTVPTSGTFSYNLTAATAPTMTHDWYAPGSFNGQAAVQFSAGSAPRVGIDAQVGIANDQFQFNTTGGAADPSQSELTLDSNLRFSGQLDANGGQETLPWMCGSVGCRAQVEGALFGPTGERLGVSYSIQSESGSTRINGVGIFSRP